MSHISVIIQSLMIHAGPLLSIRVHSPTEGIIGVKIDHFKHVRPTPDIPLFPDDPAVPSVRLGKGDDSWSVSSGALRADITANPYTITFKDSKCVLTSAGYKHQAIYDVPRKWTLRSASNSSCLETDFSSNPHPTPGPELVRYTHSELNLSPGELIYGLGEQFGAFVKNGGHFSCMAEARCDIYFQDNLSASGIRTEERLANKLTNASHSISPTAVMVSLLTTRARLRSRLAVRRSVGSV